MRKVLFVCLVLGTIGTGWLFYNNTELTKSLGVLAILCLIAGWALYYEDNDGNGGGHLESLYGEGGKIVGFLS